MSYFAAGWLDLSLCPHFHFPDGGDHTNGGNIVYQTSDGGFEAYGFRGWEWCPLGVRCNTGWTTSPQHYVECPVTKRLRATDSYSATDDGRKLFEGTIDCVD